ncbi:hypothetical protein [Saccharopolyspora hattusasensis]|uniref:hypothetical protein n=1 Tax=Saccharopolyspora hattusasensis TaxID=1128679 RepID=UPI003D99587F
MLLPVLTGTNTHDNRELMRRQQSMQVASSIHSMLTIAAYLGWVAVNSVLLGRWQAMIAEVPRQRGVPAGSPSTARRGASPSLPSRRSWLWPQASRAAPVLLLS